MKIPSKTKFRKSQRGSRKGLSKGAKDLYFGDYGLKALEAAWMSAQQIEAMRSTIARNFKKGEKITVRVFPDKPISKKPAETRMGKGKGGVEFWVAVVKRERIIVELSNVNEETAKKVLHSVSCKLPMKTKFISRKIVIDKSDENNVSS